jgi:hypothetical protein
MSFGTETLGDFVLGTSLGGAKTSISASFVITNNIINTIATSVVIVYSMKDSVTRSYVVNNSITGKIVVNNEITYSSIAKVKKHSEIRYNTETSVFANLALTYAIEAPIQILTKTLKVVLPATSRKVLVKH